MSSTNFASPDRLAVPSEGFASRRGGQGVKPLPLDLVTQAPGPRDGGIFTPRPSRSHLLAGLRTAPKSATAAPLGSTSSSIAHQYAKSGTVAALRGHGQEHYYNAPKSAYPQYIHHGGFHGLLGQQFTVDQVLAPPDLAVDEQSQEQLDPNLYAQLVATNVYLAQQQQRLQQQLRDVQAAAHQFQQLNLSSHLNNQHTALYEQQQLQLQTMQQQLGVRAAMGQGQQVYYSPVTGQYYVDSSAAAQMSSPYSDHPIASGYGVPHHHHQQQQQHLNQHQNQQHLQGTPRVQVSPPPEVQRPMASSGASPARRDSPSAVAPLPPPSSNAFRRTHKKVPSPAPANNVQGAQEYPGDTLKYAGPKTPSFTPTLPGSYGPGQARAGEHPIRQPRGPPSLDELKSKPTAKYEGSKNFAARTRRSAVHNLVRAGMERRKGSTIRSACSMSPTSEVAEELCSSVTDNDSDSGRSGSGSLAGEIECDSSRTSASGSWGAIGSERPVSRQKPRASIDSVSGVPAGESEAGSFAEVFKNSNPRACKPRDLDSQRKAPKLVLTCGEKRKTTPAV